MVEKQFNPFFLSRFLPGNRATVLMGEKGYSYKAILNHYFRGSELKKLYQ